MHTEKITISYQQFSTVDLLDPAYKNMVLLARKHTAEAYAPYSQFRVSAIALLENGEMVKSSNQENASYPVGICAERVLISTLSSIAPSQVVRAIALSYKNEKGTSNQPISPCGLCRQSLCEFEERNGSPIQLILSGQSGSVILIDRAADLLPLAFNAVDLNSNQKSSL